MQLQVCHDAWTWTSVQNWADKWQVVGAQFDGQETETVTEVAYVWVLTAFPDANATEAIFEVEQA